MAEGGFMGDMFGGLDMKELLIATAFSQSPELQPLVPHIMQGYRQAKQAKVGEQFAQGLLEAQQLAAKGDFTGANAAISNLTGVAARAGQTGSLTQMGQFVMKQQREQTQAGEMGKSFQQTFGVSDDVASVMPHISSRDRLRLARGERASYEGVSVIFDPITQKIVSTEAQPQRVDAKQLSPYGESIMERLGMTTAEFANAYNSALDSGDMAQVQLFRSFAQGLPESQEVFKREQAVATRSAVGQVEVGIAARKAEAQGAISNKYAIALGNQMIPISAARSEADAYAGVVGRSRGEQDRFLEERLDDKSSNFINIETLQPATPSMTGTDVTLSQDYIPMSPAQQAQMQEKMQAAESYMGAIKQMRTLVEQNPDLFPKKGQTLSANAMKQFQLYVKGQIGEVDPRYTEVFATLEALKAGVARYARAWGEVGNLNEQEQVRQIEGMGLAPGFREGSLTRLDTLEKMMATPINDAMKRKGFKWQLETSSGTATEATASKPLTLEEALKKYGQ